MTSQILKWEYPVIILSKTLQAWDTPEFNDILKDEIQKLDSGLLSLQKGLSQSSHVGEGAISVVILNVTDTINAIQVKTGVFYTGIIAGSCCADDPTPMNELTEYCEMQFDINKKTAETSVTIL